jgi:tetratricopeptide (TPR) repeat protein
MSTADLESLCKDGRRCFREGKFPQAISYFEKALTLDLDRVEVHDGLATSYFVMKQYDRAAEHFSRASQLRPMDPKPLINWGAVLNRQGEFQKAADVLKKALTRDGNAVEAYYNLGIAYRGLNQMAMAVDSYKEALRINPRMLDAMQNLGNVYLEMGNSKAAVDQYKKALEINPDFERAQRGLQRAEEALAAAKAQLSPFGRLVNEASLNQTKVDSHARKLRSEERVSDRQVLRRLMIEMQAAGEELAECLRDDLDVDLAQLNRGVQSSQQVVSQLLFTANDKFQTTFTRFTDLRGQLQRLVNDLKRHEEGLQQIK